VLAGYGAEVRVECEDRVARHLVRRDHAEEARDPACVVEHRLNARPRLDVVVENRVDQTGDVDLEWRPLLGELGDPEVEVAVELTLGRHVRLVVGTLVVAPHVGGATGAARVHAAGPVRGVVCIGRVAGLGVRRADVVTLVGIGVVRIVVAIAVRIARQPLRHRNPRPQNLDELPVVRAAELVDRGQEVAQRLGPDERVLRRCDAVVVELPIHDRIRARILRQKTAPVNAVEAGRDDVEIVRGTGPCEGERVDHGVQEVLRDRAIVAEHPHEHRHVVDGGDLRQAQWHTGERLAELQLDRPDVAAALAVLQTQAEEDEVLLDVVLQQRSGARVLEITVVSEPLVERIRVGGLEHDGAVRTDVGLLQHHDGRRLLPASVGGEVRARRRIERRERVHHLAGVALEPVLHREARVRRGLELVEER